MLQVHTFENQHLVNAKAIIQYPLANEVSVAIGSGAYSNFPYTVELAFFQNGDWAEGIIPEFAAYEMGGVYGHVPLHLFATFLESWRIKSA